MKYIIATNGAGMVMALLFDAHYRHKDVAATAIKGGDVVSAGVCKIHGQHITCCGESKSLGVECRPDDAATLQKLLAS